VAERVRITDVSPRDGLQNEPGVIAAAGKVRLVGALIEAGVDEVEVSSFVSPKWVPQLGDAAEVFAGVAEGLGSSGAGRGRRGVVLSALVPNEKGLEGALKVNAAAVGGDGARGGPLIGKVSVFAAASETFSQKNTNGSIDEVIARFGPVVRGAHGAGLRVRGYISTVIACPFEGAIEPGVVARVARKLIEVGVDELDLGDTIGAGTPGSVGAMLEAVRREVGSAWWDAERMTLHLHDTFGRAAECVVEALGRGVRSFDGAVAGLGGCPYASVPGRRAPGNISTEVLVRTVHAAGYVTGVDEAKLARAAEVARGLVAGGGGTASGAGERV
jgi:hydroxymethylglutaryl-CoA lyase